ncbi:MAG: AMP-binding protein [Syntrophobacteraceae bacterium]
MAALEIVTDADRYPTLTDSGHQMLRFLREHPHAPIYRNESGNRLTAEDLDRVRAFDREVESAEVGWRQGELPPWLPEFVQRCFSEVPFYRKYGSPPARFDDIPTIDRGDLGNDIAGFFPDSVPLGRLINFRTTGTTGHPVLLASHPVVSACYLPLHKRALRRFGLELRYGSGRVGAVLIGYQRKCFTYVSVTPLMDESGFAKINLHPVDWRDPDDRARYIDALSPEVFTGDPISFEVLASLPITTRPLALISTSMTLLPKLKKRLEERFACPVLDVYSMNEAGPVAVLDESAGGHVLLQHRLYVEILDAEGRPLPPGERGEVTLTGGFNFCLPLLRYRTGDFAALRFSGAEPVLTGLEGRPPVLYRTMSGEMINNIEITHALRRYAIAQFTLHQDRNGDLTLRVAGASSDREDIRNTLLDLFEPGQALTIEDIEGTSEKVMQYTSDLAAT